MTNSLTPKHQLGKAKAFFARHDVDRSLEAALTGIQLLTLHEDDSVDILLREVLWNLSRLPEVKQLAPQGLVWKKGEESGLALILRQVVAHRKAARKEAREQTFARKQRIDKLLSYAKRLLEHSKIEDATQAFTEATDLYIDEHALFHRIGEILDNAGHPQIALRFLRKGLKISTPTQQTYALAITLYRKAGNAHLAASLTDTMHKKFGSEHSNKIEQTS